VKSGEFKGFPLDKNSFKPTSVQFAYDNSKVQKVLGLRLTPPNEALVEMGKALVKLGIVKNPSKL